MGWHKGNLANQSFWKRNMHPMHLSRCLKHPWYWFLRACTTWAPKDEFLGIPDVSTGICHRVLEGKAWYQGVQNSCPMIVRHYPSPHRDLMVKQKAMTLLERCFPWTKTHSNAMETTLGRSHIVTGKEYAFPSQVGKSEVQLRVLHGDQT